MKTPEKPQGGRPPHERSTNIARQVKALAAMGVPDMDIAVVVGLSEPTMRKYYGPELATGGIEATAKVAQSLFNQATSADKPNVAAAIFWLKCRAGWREDEGAIGKKEERQAAARKASAVSRFTPSTPPPKLVVNNK